MKPRIPFRNRAFTLLETVIAIGVLAVLLTGFMYVFAPAAAGIKKAIRVQEADRLASALEQELVTLHKGMDTESTGFEKAFNRIRNSNTATNALLIYQYRGDPSTPRTSGDGTPTPVVTVKDKKPGKDYILRTMLRRNGEPNYTSSFTSATAGDLPAVEGSVYYVKCTQLYFKDGSLVPGTPGEIKDPKNPGATFTAASDYPDAVIAFTAEFYPVSNKNPASFDGSLTTAFNKPAIKPLFTRNLAVRR